MRWISVSESLPKHGGTVAVLQPGSKPRWMYFNPDDQKFHPIRGWRRKIGVDDIEYWCPLPSEPQESKEK